MPAGGERTEGQHYGAKHNDRRPLDAVLNRILFHFSEHQQDTVCIEHPQSNREGIKVKAYGRNDSLIHSVLLCAKSMLNLTTEKKYNRPGRDSIITDHTRERNRRMIGQKSAYEIIQHLQGNCDVVGQRHREIYRAPAND